MYLEKYNFYECEIIATAYVLGDDFCNNLVESVKRGQNQVEVDDGNKVAIIRKSPNVDSDGL